MSRPLEPGDARGRLSTEAVDPSTVRLGELDALGAVELMLAADRGLVDVLFAARVELARAVDRIVACLAAGGRLYYLGAGTSGRLGVLDAAECPPTFQSDPEQVQGILAGGDEAMFRAVEGAEDDGEAAGRELDRRGLTDTDAVVGITAGGTTLFVHAGLAHARALGAATIFLACVGKDEVPDDADCSIRLVTGPETLAGSTRLRAGTATKMALNLLSTLTMARLGKVYRNLMVDVDTSCNRKLVARGERLVEQLVPCALDRAAELLEAAGGSVKVAVVMGRLGLDRETATARLVVANGFLDVALGERAAPASAR